jgi:hypothetical protein
MSGLVINWTAMVYCEGSFEVTDAELDAMKAVGVDMTDEYEIADFYKRHLGETVNGVNFQSSFDVTDCWSGKDSNLNEFEDWSPEGEIPDRFFPDEDDEAEVPA